MSIILFVSLILKKILTNVLNFIILNIIMLIHILKTERWQITTLQRTYFEN